MRLTTVTVEYTFLGPTGDRITTTVPGEAWDSEDKGSSKAMAVAFRTALIQVLAIPTKERDPHAGPVVSTKLMALRDEAKALTIGAQGWTFDQLADEYAAWSQGADIAAADVDDMEEFVATLRPRKTMQRGRP
jgi:hypothetical protein